LLKTLLLTGQRREKVLRMRWDDISDGVWAIPTAKREKGNAGRVKLPPSLLDIVNAQPQIAGNPYVFAGRGSGPFNNFSQRTHELNKKLSEKLGEVQQWQLHDLRRTARSLMSRAGVRPDIAERVLGHVRPGVEGIYDRHHYDSDKADALARLAALVESIINPPPANVVPLTKQKRAPRGARTKLRPPAGSKDVTSRAFGMTFIGAEAFRPKKP